MQTMNRSRTLLLASLLSLCFSAAASAVPITLQLDSVVITGAATPSTQTYGSGLPLVGSGSLDFGPGTGSLSLPDHSILIDATFNGPGTDAQMDVTGWFQTITAIDGSGNITSTGGATYSCPYPIAFCNLAPPPNTGWAPADGTSPSSAVIDTGLQTITVVDNSDDGATGSVTYSFSYTIVPEPGTGLLTGCGLVVLGALRRRRRGRDRDASSRC
jgi:hypothetical protein